MPLLFSYGTLQQPEVQQANYGRLLEGTRDALVGYRLAPVAIDDPEVVRISGQAVHNIACLTGESAHRISGVAFEISSDELAATDAYEVNSYDCVDVTLESGRRAYCYVQSQGTLTR